MPGSEVTLYFYHDKQTSTGVSFFHMDWPYPVLPQIGSRFCFNTYLSSDRIMELKKKFWSTYFKIKGVDLWPEPNSLRVDIWLTIPDEQ